jgi:hypothetical protein
MKPVQTFRREKPRHGIGTALDQDAAKAELRQRRCNMVW